MIKYIFVFFLIPAAATAKIKVAVIDSGIKREYLNHPKICGPVKDFVQDKVDDSYEHGTNVVGLIIKEAPKNLDYCITMYKAFSRLKKGEVPYLDALKEVAKDRPDILNISAGGPTNWEEETKVIKKLLDQGTIVVAAAGNNGSNLGESCNYFPACIDKRIIVVGNGIEGKYSENSNRGGVVDAMMDGQNQSGFGVKMSGTSQATARMTAFVLQFLKWKSK